MHPWSEECLISEKNVSMLLARSSLSTILTSSLVDSNLTQMETGAKLCINGSKGYEDIFSVEYQVKETLLHVLLIIMFFGGFLAMLSNSFVLFFGLTRRNLFPPEILSLAVTDFLTGLLGTPSVMAIYYFKHARFESDPCSNQMKVFLNTTKIYNYKWIVPNFLKASTCFHLLYFTILRLHDIQNRLLRKRGKSSSNCNSNSYKCRPTFLVLLHLAAVLLSCINIFVEEDIKEWCCKMFPYVEVWLTVIIPILILIILNFVIFKKTGQLEEKWMKHGSNSFQPARIRTEQAVDTARSPAFMVGALLTCYLPLIVKWHFCGFNSFIWSLMSQALVQANSFMNPFIFAFKVKRFQQELLKALIEVPEISQVVEMEEMGRGEGGDEAGPDARPSSGNHMSEVAEGNHEAGEDQSMEEAGIKQEAEAAAGKEEGGVA